MKKALSLIIAVLMLASVFAGCSGGQSSTTPTPAAAAPAKTLDQKTVRVGIAYDPNNLEPYAALNNGRIDVLRCVYEFLFDREGTGGKLTPCIGSSYKQIDDFTYTISIYNNVYDSKGNHITAADIVFDFQEAIKLGNLVMGLGNVTDVKALDDYTVQMVFNSKAAGVFENAITNVYIVSKSAYQADSSRMASNPIGTGAYVVEKFVPGSSVSFVKAPKYWQSDDKRAPLSKANIGRVIYKVIPEKSQMTIALQNKEVDIAYYVQPTDVSHFDKNGDTKGFSVLSKPADLAQVLLFNCDSKDAFANQALRQCVAYAINKNVILQNVYGNQGGICYTFGTPVFADYQSKWNNEDYYNYNVDKAKAKLTEAGYTSGKLNIKLMTDNSTEHQKMAQIIQAMLGQVGINVQILAYDQTLYSTYRFDPTQWDVRIDNKSSFDYVTSVWKFSFDATMYKGATSNFFKDDKLQTLLATAMDSKTHTPENIDACHQYLKDSCIGYGMCYGVNYYVYADTIKNVALDFKNCVPAGACEYTNAFVGG